MKLYRVSRVIDIDTLEPKTIEIWTKMTPEGLVMFVMKPGTQLELDL